MRLADYLLIRSSINAVRQHRSVANITTAEFGILSLLQTYGALSTSDLARMQDTSRPTTSHRLGNLEELRFIERKAHPTDSRSTHCSITPEGLEAFETCMRLVVAQLPKRLFRSIMRVSVHEEMNEAICFEFMRRFFLMSASLDPSSTDLVLLACSALKDHIRVNHLVERTGLLQPTISMTIKRLERKGYLQRSIAQTASGAITTVCLTDGGKAYVSELVSSIHSIQLHHRYNS